MQCLRRLLLGDDNEYWLQYTDKSIESVQRTGIDRVDCVGWDFVAETIETQPVLYKPKSRPETC